jgi:hypothetical protein
MVATEAHKPDDRLAWLVKRLARTALGQSFDRAQDRAQDGAQDRDASYLVTGPQAAFEYHHWLTALENLVTLQVYAEEVPLWQQMAGDGCQVFETPPTTAQVRAAPGAIILDPTLEAERYRRRRMINGLAFVAPEDLCLDLLARARGETSLAEAAAIIVAGRDALAWDLLLKEAEGRGLARRLGALLDAINLETEADLAPSEAIQELGRWVELAAPPPEEETCPPGRHRSIPTSYQPIAERWGVRLALPRYVVGKVVLDLQPQRS